MFKLSNIIVEILENVINVKNWLAKNLQAWPRLWKTRSTSKKSVDWRSQRYQGGGWESAYQLAEVDDSPTNPHRLTLAERDLQGPGRSRISGGWNRA